MRLSFVTALLIFGPLVTWAQAQDLPCYLQSTNDGHGLFTYTLQRGIVPYVWGLTPQYDRIEVQSYGILEVQEPPGWTHTVSASGMIYWTVLSGIVYLEEPLTFTVRSCLSESALYTKPDWLRIWATVYMLPDHKTYAGGYQGFDYTGPTFPHLSIGQSGTNVIVQW